MLKGELRQKLLVGLVLVAATALVTRGLWSSPHFFQSHDSVLQLYRTFALDQVLREGVVYPRWLPFLAYGYGYPIFNYYSLLSTYVAETLHLTGLAYPDAVEGMFIVFVFVMATGAYALGKELYRVEKNAHLIGVLVAIAFLFFPYTLINLYIRGATEMVGAGLVPWLFWALRRARVTGTASAFVCIAVLIALLLFGHSLTLLLFAPILFLFALSEVGAAPRAVRFATFLRIAAATLLGAGLSAIYWLPMIAELSQARIGNGVEVIQEALQSSFVPFSKLIQFTWLYQYDQALFPIGLVPALLGAFGLVLALVAPKNAARRVVLFFACASVIAALAMTEPARDVWSIVPLMTNLQFSWRALLVVGLGFAIVIGAVPVALDKLLSLHSARVRSAVQVGVVLVLSLVLTGTAMQNLQPEELVLPRGEITPARLAQLEVFTQHAGTTTWGEYLPQAVQVNDFMGYRAPADSKAAGAQIDLQEFTPTRRAFDVSSQTGATIRLHAFYSPDWQASLDGKPVSTYASTLLALETIDVPAGRHEIELVLGATPPRLIGTLLAAVSAFIVLGLAAWSLRRRESEIITVLCFIAFGATSLGLPTTVALAAKPTAIERESLDVAPDVRLIGMQVADGVLEAGTWRVFDTRSSLHLTVYWHALAGGLRNTPVVWSLVDQVGSERSRRGQLPRYATAPQQTWMSNEIIQDDYDLPVTALDRGSYTLRVAYGNDQPFVDAGRIFLERGGAPAKPAPVVAHRVDARLGDQILLIGYHAPQPPVPGSRYGLDLVWQADRDIYENYTVFLQLLDGDGKIAAQYDGTPGEGLSPTTTWIPGEPVHEHRHLDLPADLTPGLYRLVVGLYRFSGMQRLPVVTPTGTSPDDQVELGIFKIAMNAQAVAPEQPLNLTLGPSIRLLGHTAAVDGTHARAVSDKSGHTALLRATQNQSLELDLYWQAIDRLQTDYTVFVHILNKEGQVVAQRDQMPGQNRYPTHIWDAGEKVVDAYRLPLELPTGTYTIAVGMYDPTNGERLVVRDFGGNELPDRQIVVGHVELVGQR